MIDKTKPPDGWRPRAAPESGSAVSANTGTNSPVSTIGQPTHVLRPRPIAGLTVDSVLALRRPLKTALRRYGLRCISIAQQGGER